MGVRVWRAPRSVGTCDEGADGDFSFPPQLADCAEANALANEGACDEEFPAAGGAAAAEDAPAVPATDETTCIDGSKRFIA
jgi:hypothetical protein